MKHPVVIITSLTAALVSLASLVGAADIPEGFAVYSKGDGYNRTLHMVQLGPAMSEADIAASEEQICSKGSHGGDIQGVISFDGEWLAFSRSVDAGDLYGDNDYHHFDGWSVHIIKLHDANAQPIVVSGKGSYWPSWGDDSTGPNKTLYYSTAVGTVRAVTVSTTGGLSNDRQVADIKGTWSSGFEGFIMTAPNGKFVAARWSGAVHAAHFAGPLAGQRFSLNSGCMPSVCADSEWVVHANNKRGRADGTATGSVSGDGSGDYHYGSSVDMQWFVARTAGNWQVQNDGFDVHLFELSASSSAFSTARKVRLTNDGSWPDVHVYPDNPDPPQLTRIVLTPTQASIAPEGSLTLTASVLDQYSRSFTAPVSWTVSGGGQLNPTSGSGSASYTSEFTSSGTLGTFTITVSSGAVSASTDVTVEEQPDLHIKVNCGNNDYGVDGWETDDSYVSGGADWTNTNSVDTSGVALAGPAQIYRSVRHQSPHTYNFSEVPNGTYTVRLHFADAYDNGRSMDYTMEGQRVLSAYDIVAHAGGINKAVVEELTVSVSDGNGLQIEAESGSGDVFEAAIEILAGGTVIDCTTQPSAPGCPGDCSTYPDGPGCSSHTDPSITIVSPTAGDVWCAGEQHTIEWTAENLYDIVIFFSSDGGETWEGVVPTIDTGSPDWQAYPWTVPDLATDQAIIRIFGYSGEVPTMSNAFTIDNSGECTATLSPTELAALTGGCTAIPTPDWAAALIGCFCVLGRRRYRSVGEQGSAGAAVGAPIVHGVNSASRGAAL